jgi:hypothetical protein
VRLEETKEHEDRRRAGRHEMGDNVAFPPSATQSLRLQMAVYPVMPRALSAFTGSTQATWLVTGRSRPRGGLTCRSRVGGSILSALVPLGAGDDWAEAPESGGVCHRRPSSNVPTRGWPPSLNESQKVQLDVAYGRKGSVAGNIREL